MIAALGRGELVELAGFVAILGDDRPLFAVFVVLRQLTLGHVVSEGNSGLEEADALLSVPTHAVSEEIGDGQALRGCGVALLYGDLKKRPALAVIT